MSHTERLSRVENSLQHDCIFNILLTCFFFQDENIEFYAPSVGPMVPEIVVSQFLQFFFFS